MAGVALDEAGIISTVLEGILYGFSLFMFAATIWALFYGHTQKNVNHKMFMVSFFLLIFSTTHMVVDIVRVLDGLVFSRDTFPGGPPAWFADVAQSTFIIKNAIYTLQTLLGDGVMIYRCYVVWQSFWIIILPSMLLCAVGAAGVGSVYSASQATANSGNIFFKETGQWITAFYACTLATNLMATGLLVYRIWSIDRKVSKATGQGRRSSLLPILLIIVDAGALYSVTLLAALICFVCKSNGQYIVLDMVTPIISIAFYMVIIRVGTRKATRPSLHSGVDRAVSSSQVVRTVQSTRDYKLKPLQVHVTSVTDTDNDNGLNSSMEFDGVSDKRAEEV